MLDEAEEVDELEVLVRVRGGGWGANQFAVCPAAGFGAFGGGGGVRHGGVDGREVCGVRCCRVCGMLWDCCEESLRREVVVRGCRPM